MTFRCVIVTPEQQLFNEDITQAIIPAHDGLLGILTDRAPLMVKLGVGPLRIDLPDHKKRWFYVDEGIAQMKDNHLTILSRQVTPAEEINAQAAQAEYAEALARKATDPKTTEDRNKQLERARAKQEIAHKE